jgi:hypothetical protein
MQDRPIVDIKLITYNAKDKTFTLDFARGGSAKLSIQALDQEHMAIDVALEGAIPRNLPFASLRSMYITETNNDAARVAWKPRGANRWGEAHVMDFKTAEATDKSAPKDRKLEMVCTSERVTGSRFSRKVCHSREDREMMQRAGRETVEKIQERPVPLKSE